MLDNTDVDIKTNSLVSDCYPPVKDRSKRTEALLHHLVPKNGRAD